MLERLLAMQNKAPTTRPMATIGEAPMASAQELVAGTPNTVSFMKSVKSIYEQLEGMGPMLQDPKQSSIRIVLNPERMVINESQTPNPNGGEIVKDAGHMEPPDISAAMNELSR